jgi:hypothetical protein
VPAVSFEVELPFEGIVDRFDDLAQGPEEPGPGRVGLALAGGPQQPDTGRSQRGLERGAVVVLVADQDSVPAGW